LPGRHGGAGTRTRGVKNEYATSGIAYYSLSRPWDPFVDELRYVHYLQTPTYFADIRIPKARSGFLAVKSFADLTDQQLRLLAGQNGFAGRTTLAGTVATWSDEIAFQPSDGTADTGRLERRPPDGMHEIGLDGSYTESWRRLSDGTGQYVVIRVEHSGRLLRSLVVVGNRFVYVRNRVKDLPTASSLEALIETTKATREEIVDYLDCEFFQ
jgi:hypothetical protein